MTDDTDLGDFEEFLGLDRPRGILTKEDRRYLVGEKEVSDQAERDTRYRIRERVKNSLADFELLLNLRDEDRETVFNDLDSHGFSFVVDALAFLYRGVDDSDYFESLLARAIKQEERRENPGRILDVSVSIKVEEETPDVGEVVDRLIAGEGTLDDFNYLLVKEEILPVIEHFQEEGEDLQITVPHGSKEELIMPSDELEELRELYGRYGESSDS
jgi:hypothetical protein